MRKIFNKKNLVNFLAGILIIFVCIQFVSPETTNPPVNTAIDFMTIATPPENVRTMIKNSCYDCHSHETVYPWYNNIAPVSWLVSSDVKEGRKELNFSEWGNYTLKRKTKKLEESAELIEKNEMPLWFYKPLHSEANLNEQQKQELIKWLNEYNTTKK